ncbi:hypothetical protein [Hymenobacter ginsengisoli]|uniref:hypothetical protein n=1 Tax=Hymenobacter sp. KCTC 23674 TaxID=2864219 RepID=UPI001C69A49D|nr:hypothetical protein [Hymenobacter sp. KCTC 23674]
MMTHYAQAQSTTPPTPIPAAVARPALAEPLYLINKLIATNSVLCKIDPNAIEKIDIYKEAAAAPPQWRSLLTDGIVSITTKRSVKLKSWSLAQLGNHLRIKGPVSYRINGRPVATPDLRIAREAIGAIHFTREPAGFLLDVQLVNQPMPPTPHPPGTIMIRGTAAG